MIAVEIVFWLCAGLVVYTHAGYPLVLWAITRRQRTREGARMHSGHMSAGEWEQSTCRLYL